MKCSTCLEDLVMKYETLETGKLKGKWTCSCNLDIPTNLNPNAPQTPEPSKPEITFDDWTDYFWNKGD